MNPITREEYFLAKIAGEESPEIQPVTREEIFLAKAAGMDVPELEPVTRKEWFISQISGGGGGGGGGGSAKLLYAGEVDVNTTNTSAETVTTIQLGAEALTADKILYVNIMAKNPSYSRFLRSDSFFLNPMAGRLTASYILGQKFRRVSEQQWQASSLASTAYGVYPNELSRAGELIIQTRYNSNYGSIDDTYEIKVFLLDFPSGVKPYSYSW